MIPDQSAEECTADESAVEELKQPITLWKKLVWSTIFSTLAQIIIMILIITLRVNGWEKNKFTTIISRTLESVLPTIIGFIGLNIIKVYAMIFVGSMLFHDKLKIGELPCYGDSPISWFTGNIFRNRERKNKIFKWGVLSLLAILWIVTQMEAGRLTISEKIITDSYVDLNYDVLSVNNFNQAKNRWLKSDLEYTANLAFYGVERKDGYTVFNSTTISTFTTQYSGTLQELVEYRLEFNKTSQISVKINNYMTQYIVVTTKCTPTTMKTMRIGGVDVVGNPANKCKLLLDYSRVEKNTANGVVCDIDMNQNIITLDLDKTWNGNNNMLDIDDTIPFDSTIQMEICSAMAQIRDDYRNHSGSVLSYTWSFPTTEVDRDPNLPGVMVTGVVENEISQYVAILLRFLAEQNPESPIKYSSNVYMAIIDNTKLGGKAIPFDIMVVNIISGVISVIACVLVFRIKGLRRLNAETIIDPVAIYNRQRTETVEQLRKREIYIQSYGDDHCINILERSS